MINYYYFCVCVKKKIISNCIFVYVIGKYYSVIVIFVIVLEEEGRRFLGYKRFLFLEFFRSFMYIEEVVIYFSYIVVGFREMVIDVYDLKGICFW